MNTFQKVFRFIRIYDSDKDDQDDYDILAGEIDNKCCKGKCEWFAISMALLAWVFLFVIYVSEILRAGPEHPHTQ